jgi:transposase
MSTFIGIDISKRTFDAFIAQKSRRFANTVAGFRAFFSHLPPDAYCVMEATGTYGTALAEHLASAGVAVAVINPLQIKRYAQMLLRRQKTDRADAALITMYAENQNLGADDQWQPPSDDLSGARQQQTVLEQLLKQQTALENQLEALGQLPRPNREAVRAIKTVLAGLRKTIKELEAAQQQRVRAAAGQTYQIIRSVPGIGPRATVALVVATACFSRCSTAKQLAAYVGLCPQPYQSGTSITRNGAIGYSSAPQVRSVFYMCALSAVRCNSACRALYQRLIASGKAKKVALIAAAHKLLRQVVAVVQRGQPFVDMMPTLP